MHSNQSCVKPTRTLRRSSRMQLLGRRRQRPRHPPRSTRACDRSAPAGCRSQPGHLVRPEVLLREIAFWRAAPAAKAYQRASLRGAAKRQCSRSVILSTAMPARRFSPPCTVEEQNNACFIIRDHDAQTLAYVLPPHWESSALQKEVYPRRLPAPSYLPRG